MIKLSIIVPVYNVERYLRKCVESLLSQDLPADDYEIILVDDGSTDESGIMCDEYARKAKREELRGKSVSIRVIHQENGGIGTTRNAGIAMALGEYLMFVDSDDYIEPNMLGGLVEQAGRDKLDVLRFRYQYVNTRYEIFNPYKSNPFGGNDYSEVPTDGITFLSTRMNTQCYAVTYIIKRNLLLDDKCFFTEGIYFEDTDWLPRMLAKAKRVASTNTIVYNYVQHAGSVTNAINRDKQKKVLDDKIRLLGELKRQSTELMAEEKDNSWFGRMIADTVISIIGILSTQFYDERKAYLNQLRELNIYPIQSRVLKARLINLSPRLAIELLHWKNRGK